MATYRYNPFEIAFRDAGPYLPERTVEDLLIALRARMRMGYVKDDVARTRIAAAEGPIRMLGTSDLRVLSQPRAWPDDALRRIFLDAEAVLVQGEAGDDAPVILAVGDGPPPDAERVIAYLGEKKACPILPSSAPYFTTGQIPRLAAHVDAHLRQRAELTRLRGVVLAGGGSQRMGRDKAGLDFGGRTQLERALDVVRTVCESVAVAGGNAKAEGAATIADRFVGMGPMGGLLTAMTEFPEDAVLAIACDMPFVDEAALRALVDRRNPFAYATAVACADGAPEPLFAVYEPKARLALMERAAEGAYSLRDWLRVAPIASVAPLDANAIRNVNTPSEYDLARDELSRSRPSAP